MGSSNIGDILMTKTRPRTKRDVLEQLDEVMQNNMRPGTANSDINVFAIEYPVPYGLLHLIKKEIIELREKVAKCP